MMNMTQRSNWYPTQRSLSLVLVFLTLVALPWNSACGQESDANDKPEQKEEQNAIFHADFNDEPTYIKAGQLSLKSKERTFRYSKQVTVEQGDLTLTSDELIGHYDEKNQIQDLVATGNVIIVRGDTVRATGGKAEFLQSSDTITLTESPELQQNDSVLTADIIRIFLNEDRSAAEGNVRVKLVENKEGANPGNKKKGAFSLHK